MKLVSWNVNGLRAAAKKGFTEWLAKEDADIVCLQEVKASMAQLEELSALPNYTMFLSEAEKKGYSGVAVYTKEEPLMAREGLTDETYNTEGRVLVLAYPEFVLYNVYFPNGGRDDERRAYKNGFNEALMKEVNALRDAGEKVIICGDVNIAHNDIDLKNPKANEKHSGFLPEERRFLDEFLASGFVDTYRHLHPEEKKYSWWSYRFGARATNAGWRIDYFFISESLLAALVDAEIDNTVLGSDHCPVSVTLAF